MLCRPAIVRTLLGVLLLATAGFKLFGLGTAGVASYGWFAQPWVQLLAAEWELVLGAWLLSGVAVRASWWFALVTFLAFATISGYMGWIGVASCNCLGAIKTNPWWTFAVDVVAVLGLLVSRPQTNTTDNPLKPIGVWLMSVGISCSVLSWVGVLYFGSVEVVFAKVRGDSLGVTPVVNFGSGQPGETLVATATVTNYTDQPVRLIGGTSDCSCVAVDDFPLTIPPGDKGNFRIRLRLISEIGQLNRTAVVHTDHPQQKLYLRLVCRIIE